MKALALDLMWCAWVFAMTLAGASYGWVAFLGVLVPGSLAVAYAVRRSWL